MIATYFLLAGILWFFIFFIASLHIHKKEEFSSDAILNIINARDNRGREFFYQMIGVFGCIILIAIGISMGALLQ